MPSLVASESAPAFGGGVDFGLVPQAIRDVARARRHARELAVRIADAGDPDRDRDARAGPGEPHALEMIDALPALQDLEELAPLALTVRRQDDADRRADRLLRAVAEQLLGGRVPAREDAIEGGTHDGIRGCVHDRGEAVQILLRARGRGVAPNGSGAGLRRVRPLARGGTTRTRHDAPAACFAGSRSELARLQV
jgi:hypothetical protein